MLKSIAQNPFVLIAQSFNERRPEIVTLPGETWAHKIMAHPKWAPKKTQPSPKDRRMLLLYGGLIWNKCGKYISSK